VPDGITHEPVCHGGESPGGDDVLRAIASRHATLDSSAPGKMGGGGGEGGLLCTREMGWGGDNSSASGKMAGEGVCGGWGGGGWHHKPEWLRRRLWQRGTALDRVASHAQPEPRQLTPYYCTIKFNTRQNSFTRPYVLPIKIHQYHNSGPQLPRPPPPPPTITTTTPNPTPNTPLRAPRPKSAGRSHNIHQATTIFPTRHHRQH